MSSANLDSADLKAVAYKGIINEDVMQKIWDISKIPLPLTDRIGTESCKNSYKEWTQDTLSTPDITNARVDGDDAAAVSAINNARVGNHCQISTKTVRVSTRANESSSVGGAGTLSYQVMRRQQELRRDVEAIMLTSQASIADTGTAAGKSGGLGAWLVTNDFRGTGGSAAGFANGVVAAPVTGTNRALSETLIRNCVKSVYSQGGDPSVLMTTPDVVASLSAYLFSSSARIATMTSEQGKTTAPATALGAVNVFVTDFGTLDIVANRLQQLEPSDNGVNVYIIDPQYLSIGYLHGYRTEALAKTGLADNKQIAVDWTLIVHTEKAHGVIADVDPAAAVVA